MILEFFSLVVSYKFKELDFLENILFFFLNRVKNLFLLIGYRMEKLILVCLRGMMEFNVFLVINILDLYFVELV